MTAIIVQFKPNFTGAGSRKRTASNSVASAVDGTDDADAVSSATKKVKTDGDAASSTTEVTDGSNGVGKEADATEAAAAVASIADEDSTTTTTTSTAAAASSEAASSST